jgi:hypothetical protein
MYIVDIGFSHGAEPLLTWCGAYTRMVSSHSRQCQKPLETMPKVTPQYAKSYSADCSAVIIRKNYPPIHQTPRKPRHTGRLSMVYSLVTIHQLYTILFTMIMNRPQKSLVRCWCSDGVVFEQLYTIVNPFIHRHLKPVWCIGG